MTEVSMQIVRQQQQQQQQHHPSGNGVISDGGDISNNVALSAASSDLATGGAHRSDSANTTTALFIQAPHRSIVSIKETPHVPARTSGEDGEDQTIVIDLTDERCNVTRSTEDNLHFIVEAETGSTTDTGYVGGSTADTGYAGAAAARGLSSHFDHVMPRVANLSSTSSSLDVHPPGDEDGSHFLISRMLNGSGEDNEDNSLDDSAFVKKMADVELHQRDDELNGKDSPNLVRFPRLSQPSDSEDSAEDDCDARQDFNLSTSLPSQHFLDNSWSRTPPKAKLRNGGGPQRPRQLNLIKSNKARANSDSVDSQSSSEMNQRSRSLRRDAPLTLFGGSQSLSEASPRYHTLSNVYRLRSSDGQRSLDRRTTDRRHLQGGIRTKKSHSSDFLDRIDPALGRSGSAGQRRRARARAKMNKIEKSLYLGNMEAATDVILLESHEISHIVTLDSVPLPRKISSFLPRIQNLHLQVTDLPDEDILSYVTQAVKFITEGIDAGGNVLVHCFRGKSRSATVVIAYMMQKHGYTMEKAMKKVRAKRDCINPHDGFLAQLKLYEVMEYQLDPSNVQFKMFKMHLASERMRKAKILFRDSLDNVLDDDPGEYGSAKGHYSVLYKCKRCRRTLATSHNLMPHVKGELPTWKDPKWSLPAEEVLEGVSDLGLDLCTQSVFVNPIRWMQAEVKQNLSGKLFCPNCQCRVGTYSWVKGNDCSGCKVKIAPAFELDITEIIFKTKNRYLQSTGREPVIV